MLAEATTLIILRYADGEIGLTGWGFAVMMMTAIWAGLMSRDGK